MWRATQNGVPVLCRVDADTKIFPDSLMRMVFCMVVDVQIKGLCNEYYDYVLQTGGARSHLPVPMQMFEFMCGLGARVYIHSRDIFSVGFTLDRAGKCWRRPVRN